MSLRYVEPSPIGDDDHVATLAALMAALRPGAIVRVSDAPTGVPITPALREAHRRFKQILSCYTNDVAPKSIDEFVMDFHGSQAIRQG